MSCILSLWVIFWFCLGLGGFCWGFFLGLHEGISIIVKGNVRKPQRFCQKKSKHVTACQPHICPLAQTGVQWDVRYIIEFDFLSLSGSEAGTGSAVPECWLRCLSDEVLSGHPVRGSKLLPSILVTREAQHCWQFPGTLSESPCDLKCYLSFKSRHIINIKTKNICCLCITAITSALQPAGKPLLSKLAHHPLFSPFFACVPACEVLLWQKLALICLLF